MSSFEASMWRILCNAGPVVLLLCWVVQGNPATTSRQASRSAPLGEDAVLVTGGISQIGYRNHGRDKSVNGTETFKRHMGAFKPIDPIKAPVNIWGLSFQNMIIGVNPGVEVLIHSWNPDVALNFSEYLSPVRGIYEVNSVYQQKFMAVLKICKTSSVSQISKAFSFMQAGRLMLEREAERGQKFKRVLFIRSDVLLLSAFRIRDMVADPKVVYVSSVCGNNSDSYYAMSRDAAVTFSGIYNAIGADFPARVSVNGRRQCEASSRHWMTRFIEDKMNMTVGTSDSQAHVIYRFLTYPAILQHADFLKSLEYPPECAIEIAKVTVWGHINSQSDVESLSALELDGYNAFHHEILRKRTKYISKILQFWVGTDGK
jgi:hypothetical protein